jgi:hypothetical protein
VKEKEKRSTKEGKEKYKRRKREVQKKEKRSTKEGKEK